MANRRWELDGKDFKGLLKHLGREAEYAYLFGGASSHVHGSWYEMSLYHLEKQGRYYKPNLDFHTADPRLTGAVTKICLMGIEKFIKWNKTDPDGEISKLVNDLNSLVSTIDLAHEKKFEL